MKKKSAAFPLMLAVCIAFTPVKAWAVEDMDMLTTPVTEPAYTETTTTTPLLTYVDVDITTQTMTYFENGIPVLVSPCVTGKPGSSTPRGMFTINSRVPGKYLNGKTWHVWVNRWMRFYGNVGLHDATWRKNFGGDIYKKNGSHGCVNLPHDVAVALYDRVGIGTVVYVH